MQPTKPAVITIPSLLQHYFFLITKKGRKGLLAPYLLGPGLEAEESVSHNLLFQPHKGIQGRRYVYFRVVTGLPEIGKNHFYTF